MQMLGMGYNDFDIILGPFPACHSLFTALHAPCDVPYLVTMVIGCGLVLGIRRCDQFGAS